MSAIRVSERARILKSNSRSIMPAFENVDFDMNDIDDVVSEDSEWAERADASGRSEFRSKEEVCVVIETASDVREIEVYDVDEEVFLCGEKIRKSQ